MRDFLMVVLAVIGICVFVVILTGCIAKTHVEFECEGKCKAAVGRDLETVY